MKARSQAKLKRYRRYNSTGLSGTLEALPRSPQVQRSFISGKWIALAVIALLVVGAILWIWLSDTLYVSRISVSGNALTPAQEIVQTSGIGGQHLFSVNAATASERIVNGNPSIKSARVDCQLPNRCVIKVQERQPSVAWRFGGAVTWIADDGLAFAAKRNTDLPLITIDALQGPALLPGKEADPRIVKSAVAVAKALPTVRQYKYTAEHGLASNFVTSIAQAVEGALWFGTYGAGVSCFDGVSWVTYTKQAGLVDDTVLSLAAAPDGTVWVGTLRGISSFDGKDWTTYTPENTNGVPIVRAGALAIAPDGPAQRHPRLWRPFL